MTEPRKASDILLKIEESIDSIPKEFSSNKEELKQIKALLNTISADLALVKGYYLNTDHLLKLVLQKINIENRPLQVEPVRKEIKAEPIKVDHEVKEVVVHQTALYASKKPIPLAEVRVSQNNQLITKTRTNSQGKWTLKLAPGTYQFHVVKAPIDNKQKIDIILNITVPSDQQQMEIPWDLSLNKG